MCYNITCYNGNTKNTLAHKPARTEMVSAPFTTLEAQPACKPTSVPFVQPGHHSSNSVKRANG